MSLDTRELFARLIQCEAGGEGENGMAAVATVVMNRATATVGEFSRVGKGGDVRAVITQPGQFTCMRESVGGSYNAQNVYNMTPTDGNDNRPLIERIDSRNGRHTVDYAEKIGLGTKNYRLVSID